MAKFNGQRGEKRNLAEMLLGIKTPKPKKRVKKMEPGGPAVATADPRVYDRSQGYISQAPGPSRWEAFKQAMYDHNMADDSNFENTVEMIDGTGVSGWDDAYRAYQSMNARGGMYPNADEALDMLGALPLLGSYKRTPNLAKYATSPLRYLGNEAMRRIGPYATDALNVFDGLEDMYGWLGSDKKLRGGETDPKGKGDKEGASDSGWSLTPAQQATYEYLIREAGFAPAAALAAVSVTQKESTGNAVQVENSYSGTTAKRIRGINGRFRDELADLTDAQIDSLKMDDRAFFNRVYANAAGNQGGDDGYNYRGRGLVQLTGRANYADASQAIYGDDRLVTNPDLLLDDKIAGDVAGWFLTTRGRGTSGYLDFDPASENLTPEQLQQVMNGAYATVASAGTLPKSHAVTDSMATRYGQYNVGMPKMQQFVQNNIAHLPNTQLASMPDQAAIDAERAQMQNLLGYVDANNAMIDQQAEMYGNGNSYLSDGYVQPSSLATAQPPIPQQPALGQYIPMSQSNPVGRYLATEGRRYGGVTKKLNGGPSSMMETFLDVLNQPTIPGLDNEGAINQALIRYYDMPDMQGLQPGQVPAAVSEYLNKGAMQNLAQTGVSALGSLFTANAPERLNAKYSFNDAMGGMLSGVGAGMAFGPVGAAIGAVGGLGKSIISHMKDQSLYGEQRKEYRDDQIKMAESMVPQMNAMGYANYNQYGAPSTFAYGGNTQPDYETEKSEVILSSPHDRPIAMRGGSYKQLSNNLFKANGRSHANGGIPTKGATQSFVDNGGRQHQSPYVFSDSKDMRFDATNILKMIS